MKKKFLCLLTLVVSLLVMCLAFISCSDNSNKSYKYHKENVRTLSTLVDSSIADSMVSALENTCAITTSTKLVAEDMLEVNSGCYELYAGLMVRFYVQDGEITLYTFETNYSEVSKILLYDSTTPNSKKVLTESERKSLIYTQRRAVVQGTLQITPSNGVLLHNALGSTKVDLTFRNCSYPAISYLNVVITPYMSGVDFSSKNKGYTLDVELPAGGSIERTLTTNDWKNYDSYKITKATIMFADGSTIGFNAFDCQFLDGNGDSPDTILRDSQITYHLYDEQTQVESFYSGFGANLITPYRYGYNFIDWYDNAEYNGNPINIIPAGQKVNIDLFAKWEEKNYINYNYQYDGKVEKVYIEDNKIPTILTPAREGYSFEGWYTTPSFEGSPVTEIENLTKNIELYAKWTGNSVYLIYDGSGSTSGTMNNQLFRVGETLALNENKFVRDGYTFIGWSLEKTSKDIIEDRSEYTMQPTTYEAIKIYARWSKEIRTVEDFNTINGNNAEYYRLLNDIDFANQKATTIEDFYGIFEGNGYTIKNSTTSLFTRNFGDIKNLIIENCSIATNYSGPSSGYGVSKEDSDINGGFVAVNQGYIKNCAVKIECSFSASRDYLGGFCGRNIGIIENSFSTINITVQCGGYTVHGSLYIGGFVGENYERNAKIINCYSNGKIVFTGNPDSGISLVAGGFIGASWDGELERCYSNVSIDSNELNVTIGGFIGAGCQWLNFTKECSHTIKFCFAVGKINSTNSRMTGGFIGNSNYCNIEACYRNEINLFVGEMVNNEGTLTQNEKFYSKDFYIDNNIFVEYINESTLQENENAVWVLTDGELPKLYWETDETN